MEFNSYLDKSRLALDECSEAPIVSNIAKALESIIRILKNGNKILVCGNGGSASDASHIAGELVGRFLLERDPLPVISLSADTSVLTAWSNDYSYDEVFARQIKALGNNGDLLLALSTSGNSKNVIKGAIQAKDQSMMIISLTGKKANKLSELSDICIQAPSTSTPIIQQCHQVFYHYLCLKIEEAFK